MIPSTDTRYVGYFEDSTCLLRWLPEALSLVTPKSDLIMITSGVSPKDAIYVTEGNLKFDASLRHRITGKQFLIKFGFQNSAKRGNVVYEKLYKYIPFVTQIEETEGKFGLFALSRENDYINTTNHNRFLETLNQACLKNKPLLYFYDNSWEALVAYSRKLARYFNLPLRTQGPKTGRLI